MSMTETGQASEPDVNTGAGAQMWSGGREDRPEQLMAPDVQEEVSLLEQTHN